MLVLSTVDCVKKNKVVIRFLDTGTELEVYKSNVRAGNVKDTYRPVIFGVGYLGSGSMKGSSKAYRTWGKMLGRCYNKEDTRYSLYGGVGVKVCTTWHNFTNFLKWYKTNYITGYTLDKDLTSFLEGDAKVYTRDTCVFLPHTINNFLSVKHINRELPVGVWEDSLGMYWSGYGRINKKQKRFETIPEAVAYHRETKILAGKALLDKHRDTLPEETMGLLERYMLTL